MRRICAGALLATTLGGCGLGTEIGNGFKPAGGGTSPSGGQPAGADHSTQAAPGAGGAATNSPAKTTPGDGGAPSTPADAASVSVSAPLPFNIDVLTAPCGSVFSQPLTSPITFFHQPTGGAMVPVLTAAYDVPTALWTLADISGTVLRHVAKSPTAKAGPTAFAVLTTDAAGAPVPSALSCTVGAAAPAGADQTQALQVSGGGLTAALTWTIAPAAAGGSKPLLSKVSLTESDKGPSPVELSTTP